MLASVPSTVLTKWMAFERINGPLGDRYIADMLASIHEALQQLIIITAGDKSAKVQSIPRPHEMYEYSQKAQRDEFARSQMESSEEES